MTAVTVEDFGDILTDFAEKVGETTQNVSDDRKRKINNAYFFISNKRNWWWREATSTDTTTTALSYTLPTTFAYFHPKNPVKIGTSWRTLVPFSSLQEHDGTDLVVAPPYLRSNRYAYIYGTSIYFIQEAMSASQTITYYFYKRVTPLDALSDEPIIPYEFREIISIYAAGMHLIAQGGSDATEGERYIEIFDTYMKDMEKDDDNRREFGIRRRALDPEEASIYHR